MSQFFVKLFFLKWYYWNKNNKLLYFIFLTQCSNSAKVKFTEKTCLNYKFGIRVKFIKALAFRLYIPFSDAEVNLFGGNSHHPTELHKISTFNNFKFKKPALTTRLSLPINTISAICFIK